MLYVGEEKLLLFITGLITVFAVSISNRFEVMSWDKQGKQRGIPLLASSLVCLPIRILSLKNVDMTILTIALSPLLNGQAYIMAEDLLNQPILIFLCEIYVCGVLIWFRGFYESIGLIASFVMATLFFIQVFVFF